MCYPVSRIWILQSDSSTVSPPLYDIINTHNCFDLNSLCLKIKNFWYLSWNPHKSWIYPMAMCFVPNVYYVCLACAARSILVYCKCCKEKNTTTISRGCTQRGPHVISLYSSTIISNRSAFCQFPFRWMYYCLSSKSTGKETGKTYLVQWVLRFLADTYIKGH